MPFERLDKFMPGVPVYTNEALVHIARGINMALAISNGQSPPVPPMIPKSKIINPANENAGKKITREMIMRMNKK